MIRVARELRHLVVAAIEQGWEVTKTNGGHLKFKAPGGGLVYTPSTPGQGKRGIENATAELRRAGLDLPR